MNAPLNKPVASLPDAPACPFTAGAPHGRASSADVLPEDPAFTKVEIATALGVTKRAILIALKRVPSETKTVRGQVAKVWKTTVLSEAMLHALKTRADRHGAASIESFIASQQTRWEPRIPWEDLAEPCQKKALLLKEALRLALAPMNGERLTKADFERRGVEDYARVFGETISERRWRDVFKRTCDRASTNEDFDRDDIYLDERLFRRPLPAGPGATCDVKFADLHVQVRSFLALQLSPLVKNRCWEAAFIHFDLMTATGHATKDARREVCDFLLNHARALVRSKSGDPGEAFLTSFKRKYTKWLPTRTLSALDDGRRKQDRALPYDFDVDEWTLLTSLTATLEKCDTGWREFLLSPKIRPVTREYFKKDPSKGRVRMPGWIRKKIIRDVENEQTHKRGPRTAKLNGAYTNRDPDSLASGDSDQSDDKTLDVYWYDTRPDGSVWFGQGQLLAWIDERSWRISSLYLIADKNYNGFDIRNSWTAKVRTGGLPRFQVHVEMGIWKEASVWAGSKRKDGDEILGTEKAEEGIRRLGIKLRHATLPRGKIIERVFGSLTDQLAGLPGYCGRNQQADKFEDVQRKVRLASKPGEDPREFGFLSKSQMLDDLEEIARKLNATVKYGRYHEKRVGNSLVHLSPNEAFEEFYTTPVAIIPTKFEHLFQRNRLKRLVGRNGISIQHGRRRFNYKNAELGYFKGSEMICWFNPEDPSVLRVTDVAEHTCFAVPLVPELSHNATPDEMARASAINAEFDSYQRAVHRGMKPVFSAGFVEKMFRHPVVDPFTRAGNEEIQAKEESIKLGQRQRKSAGRVARTMGITIPENVPVGDRTAGELDVLRDYLRQHGQAGVID